MPTLLTNGGPVIWLILLAAAIALVVFVERVLYCHRSQINSAEFLNGVRTVLKRDNVVEAISICDATPGPVARIVKTAILNRDHGRERVREAVEEAGLTEVPRLEEKLNLLATIAQIAPLLGLLGTIIGFIDIFSKVQEAGLYAQHRACFRTASGRRSSARRRASPWPFPSTPATIISSAASTKSSSTWNAPPPKSSTSSPKTETAFQITPRFTPIVTDAQPFIRFRKKICANP